MSKDKRMAFAPEQIDKATEAMWAAITEDDNRNIEIDIKALKAAIEAEADVNSYGYYGRTPLHYAASHGNTKVIAALLSAKADINTRDINGITPLYRAAEYGNTKAIAALLKAGADIHATDNIFVNTPLHEAAQNEHTRAIVTLLEAGADIHATNKDGTTPLHYAARTGKTRTIAALLQARADVNSKDNDGSTPLHYAAITGKTRAITALLKAGDDVNAKDNDGSTPLHCAAAHGNTKAIDTLLEAGADVNAKDNDGITPLHDAAVNGEMKVMAKLLVNGAGVSEHRLVFNDNGQQIETTEIARVRDLFARANRQLSLVKSDNGLFYKQGLEHIPQAAKVLAANETKSIIPNNFGSRLNLSAEHLIPQTAIPYFVERLAVKEIVQLREVSTSHRNALSGFAAFAKGLFTSREQINSPLSFAVMEQLLVPRAFRNLVVEQQELQRKARLEGKKEKAVGSV